VIVDKRRNTYRTSAPLTAAICSTFASVVVAVVVVVVVVDGVDVSKVLLLSSLIALLG